MVEQPNVEPERPNVPEPIGNALAVLGRELAQCSHEWLIGGSVGILLQGVHLHNSVPRDLDLYADESEAKALHLALAAYSVDGQALSETDRYRSLLSHYEIEGVTVELVGAFRVETGGSHYEARIGGLLGRYAASRKLNGNEIRFMPLVHELVFNVLRERPDRYEPVAETLRAADGRHAELLQEMIRTNRFSSAHLKKLEELLGLRLESGGKAG
jgi:hypothetical protein